MWYCVRPHPGNATFRISQPLRNLDEAIKSFCENLIHPKKPEAESLLFLSLYIHRSPINTNGIKTAPGAVSFYRNRRPNDFLYGETARFARASSN